jgi:hypothetical protein
LVAEHLRWSLTLRIGSNAMGRDSNRNYIKRMKGKSIVAKHGILKIDEVGGWVMIFCRGRAIPGL